MSLHKFITFCLLLSALALAMGVYKIQKENKHFRNQMKILVIKVDKIRDESDKVIATAYYVIDEAKTITDMTNYIPCKSVFIFPDTETDPCQ